ncbi:FIST signal transduction protein [Alishewanella sp. SMS8]|uniref:FIST signal transduction protein n=1 Tax=Alishewanella sp. SMS8 TaxID=2994676 RepID=UPI002740C1A7|nr:FIST C-terminal domain-containing protein [Alishewanella sp. SMS8]MDP5036405.1 FIST C-terminal domain-containing protein [Alishewanella sp.]MDP5460390.1 FIST C-terminal domain-containing protein [Alishewanella sp. SMS8]
MQIRTLRIVGDQISTLGAWQFDDLSNPAELAIAFGNIEGIKQLGLRADLKQLAKNWLAGSSCLGCADQAGLNNSSAPSVTVLLIDDPTGHYGVGSAELTGNIADKASNALQMAMDIAGKSHELPNLIWCLQAPGTEEAVIQGIENLVGDQVPIFGGSTADNDVSGQWLQFDGNTLSANTLLLAVFYPSTPISNFFSSGYFLTECHGVATAVTERRLYSIDNQPAAKIYNQWLQQTNNSVLNPGNILMESTLFPLGREVKQESHLPFYLLSHPAVLHEDGSLSLFSEIQVGEQLWLMQGDKTDLIARAGEVVRTAKQNLKFHYNCDAAGAIIVYCAGCMLAVKDNIDEVQQAIQAELGDIPFIVTFTFGEQGCFVDGSNRHGNLMISAVLIGAHHANE